MDPARSDNTPPDTDMGCGSLARSTARSPWIFWNYYGKTHLLQIRESKTTWNHPDNDEKSARSPPSDDPHKTLRVPSVYIDTDNIPRPVSSGQDIPVCSLLKSSLPPASAGWSKVPAPSSGGALVLPALKLPDDPTVPQNFLPRLR